MSVVAPGGRIIESPKAYDGGPIVGGYPVVSKAASGFEYPTFKAPPLIAGFEFPTFEAPPWIADFEAPGAWRPGDPPSAAEAKAAADAKAAASRHEATRTAPAPVPWWVWALVAAGAVWMFRK